MCRIFDEGFVPICQTIIWRFLESILVVQNKQKVKINMIIAMSAEHTKEFQIKHHPIGK
jgi:hypothetical protein